MRPSLVPNDDPGGGTHAQTTNDLGYAIHKRSTADFQKFVQEQVTGWAPAVKASGAKLN